MPNTNKNYKQQPQVTRICVRCKKEYTTLACYRNRKYCSYDCYLNGDRLIRRKGVTKKCVNCKKDFYVIRALIERKKFCSMGCYWNFMKGKIGNHNIGEYVRGKVSNSKGKSFPERCGENHYNWKKDRSILKRQDERNDPAYICWSRDVKRRENWKCKIGNKDCSGKLISHHILPWRDYPELRYNINNGIALCHFHHPKKRDDEVRLIPYFQSMVEVK